MDTRKITLKGVKITADDIREGVVAILSAYVQEPQFQGQTKDKLNNPEVTAQIESAVRTEFEQWLLTNATAADTIVARVIISARARAASRAASAQVSRKTAVSHRLNLPGKLADLFRVRAPTNAKYFWSKGTVPAAMRNRGAIDERKRSFRSEVKCSMRNELRRLNLQAIESFRIS